MRPLASSLSAILLVLLVGVALGGAVRSQCSTVWFAGAPPAGLAGTGLCSTIWDPDGAGPAPERLVIGGSGLIGGSDPSGQRVMTFDGIQWQALANGPGTSGQVRALTTWNGQLVAAGSFQGGGTTFVALWDGSAWQPIGTVLAAPSLLAEWNSNLVAVVNTGSGAVVSVWNGVVWSNLPPPPNLTLAKAVVSFQGLLWVGGSSPNFQGRLERWNGTTWLPTITANGQIESLATRAFQFNSTLFAGGLFTGIGSVLLSHVASTTGGTAPVWSAVGSGVTDNVLHLHARATSAIGTTIVVRTTNTSSPMQQWSGSSFVPMGTTAVGALSHHAGSYHGTAVAAGPAACLRYDGTTWVPVSGQSLDGEVRALTRSGADMIVAGTIQATAGPALNRIARWNGTTFQPLGPGVQGASVEALLTLDDGDIVVGGFFPTAGFMTVNHVARWNGSTSTWLSLASGFDNGVLALCKLPNGDLVAGGAFTATGGVPCARIAQWNGTAWSPIGSGMNGPVFALAVRSDGTLIAGGAFTIAGGAACNRIAQWNGATWLPLGAGCNDTVNGLAVRPNDDVVAVGAFTSAGGATVDRCARWNGVAWTSMAAASGDPGGAPSVFTLPNGDVVAGRGFHQPASNPDDGLARWNGSTWSGFGSGVAATVPGASVAVRALAQRADGALVVGGNFGVAGGLATRGLAVLSTTCLPTAQPYGAGCSTAVGPLVLTAATLPWLGATFRTATTGMAPFSLCVGVTGFSQVSMPLSSILAAGQPGCSLLASPDILAVVLPDGAGTAASALAIANSPALLGASFFQQSIALEFRGAMALVALRSSNALALTIGTL